jgi:nicotinamide riboside transporter PnuC
MIGLICGIFGILFISIGVLSKKSYYHLLGGISLLIYSIVKWDIIFIVLQLIFIIITIIDIIRSKSNK